MVFELRFSFGQMVKIGVYMLLVECIFMFKNLFHQFLDSPHPSSRNMLQ